jgi:hypothetical protein
MRKPMTEDIIEIVQDNWQQKAEKLVMPARELHVVSLVSVHLVIDTPELDNRHRHQIDSMAHTIMARKPQSSMPRSTNPWLSFSLDPVCRILLMVPVRVGSQRDDPLEMDDFPVDRLEYRELDAYRDESLWTFFIF